MYICIITPPPIKKYSHHSKLKKHSRSINGFKPDKIRLTVSFIVNADGTNFLEALVISNAESLLHLRKKVLNSRYIKLINQHVLRLYYKMLFNKATDTRIKNCQCRNILTVSRISLQSNALGDKRNLLKMVKKTRPGHDIGKNTRCFYY